MKDYIIRSTSDLVKLGTRMKENWFRGHSKTWNELTPLAFREKENKIMALNNPPPGVEINSANYFRKRAEVILENPPEGDNYLFWLMYMQHYGLPTRLLDWSENVLVAAFFAVVNDKNEDGELWTLYPKDLNMKSELHGVASYRSPYVQSLSRFPFLGLDADSIGLLTHILAPVAFSPKHIFPRAGAQESAFTIHKGSVEGNSQTIIEVLKEKKSLVRYIIPKIAKHQIENDLDCLGFNYRTMFPDLEGLAKDFKRMERYLAWQQPEPPTF